MNFEWDENKNAANRRKHYLDFERAAETFDDENAVEYPSTDRGELRILRIGKTIGRVLLAVVYTMRAMTVRIISARQASRNETKLYLEENLKQQADDATDPE